ncbi:unnamed protein product, partial [Vitis vinifera]
MDFFFKYKRSPDSERSLSYEQIHSHSQHLLLRVLSFSDPLISSKRMKVKILQYVLLIPYILDLI